MKRCCVATVIVLIFASASFAEGMPERIQKHLDDHLIGRWKITTRWKNEVQEAKNELKWSPQRNTVIGEWTPVGDDQSGASTQVISWDPQTEEVVFSGFSATSGYYVMRYGELDENKWTGKGTGFWEGKEWESPVSIQWKDNEYRYEDISDGEPFVEIGKRMPASDKALFEKLSELMLRGGGQWAGKGEVVHGNAAVGSEKGDKFTMHAKFQRGASPTAIIGDFQFSVTGKPATKSVAQELIGWNPTTKTVEIVNYWSSGSVETISFDRCEGTTFYGTYSSHSADGEVDAAEVAFVFDEKGNADFNLISGPNQGTTLSSWKRVSATDAQQAFQSYGDLMVGGVWTHTDADGTEYEHVYRWILNKKFLRADYVKDPNPATAVIGIDPFTGRPTYWAFHADGTHSVTPFSQPADGQWEFHYKAKEPDGTQVTGKGIGKRVTADKIINSGEMTIGGETKTLEDEWIRKPRNDEKAGN